MSAARKLSFAAWHAKAEQEAAKRTRCLTCADAELSEAIKQFVEHRKKSRAVTWPMFHRNYAVEVLGSKLGCSAILNHVRNCLKVKP